MLFLGWRDTGYSGWTLGYTDCLLSDVLGPGLIQHRLPLVASCSSRLDLESSVSYTSAHHPSCASHPQPCGQVLFWESLSYSGSVLPVTLSHVYIGIVSGSREQFAGGGGSPAAGSVCLVSVT